MSNPQNNAWQLGYSDGYSQRAFSPPKSKSLHSAYRRGYEAGDNQFCEDILYEDEDVRV